MHKTKKMYFLMLIFIALIFGLLHLSIGEEKEIYQISYINRSSTLNASQQVVKQGIMQAAQDFEFELKEVTFDDYITPKEQIDLITKEVNNAADAIIIESIENEEILEFLKEIETKIPVVFINGCEESNDPNFSNVNVDNYEMGQKLARYIVQNNANQRICLVDDGTQFTDKIKRQQGVYDELIQNKREVLILEIDKNYSLEELLEDMALGKYIIDAIVVFDTASLEAVSDAKDKKNALKNIKIYGFGKSNQVITSLEEKLISGITVPNEYSVGYLSAKLAIQELEKEVKNNVIVKHELIHDKNIYTTENQKLLFPIMQ